MKLCLCRHKATRLGRDRRGQATVIGSIFFFMIALSLITFIYEIAQNQIVMQHQDAERVTETVESVLLVLPGGHLLINVENRGPIPVKLIGLWVIDKDANNHIRYDLPDDKIDLLSWEEIEINTSKDTFKPGWTPLDDEGEYSVRLVTGRGNIIEANPFQAISGETVGVGTYPPWVSIGESEISFNPSETPVVNISSNHGGDSYDGKDVWLSVKNSGNIAFVLNMMSRVIFKDSSTGRLYSGYLTTWEKFPETEPPGDWQNADAFGNVNPTHDTHSFYPGDVLVLNFMTPREVPGGSASYNIPSNSYQVYVHLAGYDDNGKRYFQSMYYGEVLPW